jgi:hypothetical protein
MKKSNSHKEPSSYHPFDMMFSPQDSPPPTQQKNGSPQLLAPFLTEDGSIDYDKVTNNMEQVINIIQRTGPLMKQLGPIFSLFTNKK